MKDALMLLPGVVFGVGLAVSRMSDPAKVLGFLDVAGGRWDPSLAFVMVGAIGVFALMNLLIHRRLAPVCGGALPGRRPAQDAVDRWLLLGAATFGVGWGLSGVCPGPAVTDVSLLRVEVFAYLGGMFAGMVVAQRAFGVDAPPTAPAAPAAPSAEAPPAA